MTRSVHVIARIRAEDGGPSYSVPRLVAGLSQHGQQASLATLALDRPLNAPALVFAPDGMPVPLLNKLGRSKAMDRGLNHLSAEIFHAHGLWMMPSIYAARRAQSALLPFVLSPRGMLGAEALKFSWPAKRAFQILWQSKALRAVTCFHATSEAEVADIRAFGLRAPVAVVRNGMDLPELSAAKTSPPFVLALSRLHPKKGLLGLIEAFARIWRDFPTWRLRIVGMDEDGHRAELVRAINAAGLDARASVEPAVFGAEKQLLLGQASLFALPSLHENFANSVAESLAAGTPVISTKGAPWAGLQANGCGWWIDHGAAPLEAALRNAMSLLEKTRMEMGLRGRDWMRRDYSWQGVAEDMARLYDWTLGRGARPNFVYL